MESLPLEVLQHVCSYVLPPLPAPDDPDGLCASVLPTYKKSDRENIYNLRLTSKAINLGFENAFVKIVGDKETRCTTEEFQMLFGLVSLPFTGKHITRLALRSFKMWSFECEWRNLQDFFNFAKDHKLWTQHGLCEVLLAIMSKTPKLRHLRCIADALTRYGADEAAVMWNDPNRNRGPGRVIAKSHIRVLEEAARRVIHPVQVRPR